MESDECLVLTQSIVEQIDVNLWNILKNLRNIAPVTEGDHETRYKIEHCCRSIDSLLKGGLRI